MVYTVVRITALTEWALTEETSDFWFFMAVLICVAIGSFINAYIFLVRKRIIQDTPTSRIRSAAQGYIELVGHGQLIPGDTIIAPLTKTTCTWYSYSIEQKRGSGKNSRWVIVEQGESDKLFLLIDETGQVSVDPEGAVVTPAVSLVWYGHSKYPSPASAPEKTRFYSLGIGGYRYTEKRMHPGDELYAIGLFNTVGNSTAEFTVNEDVRELLAEWKKDSEVLLSKYDKNRDGQIDVTEWQKVRDDALKKVKANHNGQIKLPPVNLISQTRDKRRPYLLSAVPQFNLVRKYTFNASALITTFFIAGALATFFINVRLAS